MAARSRMPLLIGALALVVAVLAVVAILIVGSRDGAADTALARGEAIFQAGVDAAGRPIPRTLDGNRGGMMMGGAMMGAVAGGGCAACHGADGRGRATRRFTAPDITYGNLTDPAGMLEPDGGRGHTFSADDIRRAVTDGVGPDGERLDWPMPRWRLTDRQWADLLAYLKTLP